MESSYFQFLQAWAAQNVESSIFYLLAFIALPLAYSVLFDPRIIRAGFLLIGVFGMIAGLFLLLQAQFLAMAQLMIYAVGITLVIVIALMLTNPKLEHDFAPATQEHKLPAMLVGIIVFMTIYLALRSEMWQVKTVGATPPELNAVQIGMNLVGYYALPFEFASVLLFIALVGAITLARADRKEARAEEWVETNEEAYERDENNVVKV